MLAPTFFNYYSDVAIHMALEEHQGRGIKVAYLLDADQVGNRRILNLETMVTDLEFTDDMALLANNWSDHTAMLDSLSTCCKKLGLIINYKNMKSLAVLPPKDTAAQSTATIHLVREVDRCGLPFSVPGQYCPGQLWDGYRDQSRICKASSAFQLIYWILWHQRKIQASTKIVQPGEHCPP